MASDKKVILIFSGCDAAALSTSSAPETAKLFQKGAYLKNAKACAATDIKTLAGAGSSSGETLWQAAEAAGYTVAGLDKEFDMCVLEAGPAQADVEKALAAALEAADRSTLLALVAKDGIVFYGTGIAKGVVIEKDACHCCVAPTVAYVANFPVPAQCEAPIAYAALKDINLKLNEINKLKESIHNMEAAMERKARQPWDKHDCA